MLEIRQVSVHRQFLIPSSTLPLVNLRNLQLFTTASLDMITLMISEHLPFIHIHIHSYFQRRLQYGLRLVINVKKLTSLKLPVRTT